LNQENKRGTLFVATELKHYHIFVGENEVWNGVLNKGQTISVTSKPRQPRIKQRMIQ
jgi:hypothetical protein